MFGCNRSLKNRFALASVEVCFSGSLYEQKEESTRINWWSQFLKAFHGRLIKALSHFKTFFLAYLTFRSIFLQNKYRAILYEAVQKAYREMSASDCQRANHDHIIWLTVGRKAGAAAAGTLWLKDRAWRREHNTQKLNGEKKKNYLHSPTPNILKRAHTGLLGLLF